MNNNILSLQQGQPPDDPQWLKAMTAGRHVWLDRFREHYLENYLPYGGSKVKILLGTAGSGKSHMLRCIAADANELNFAVVYWDLRHLPWKFSNMIEFYKAAAAGFNVEEILPGLYRRVAEILGYSSQEYEASQDLLSILIEKEGLPENRAKREIRKATEKVIKQGNLSLPFYTLCYTLVSASQGIESADILSTCWKWLKGQKLDPAERQRARLFERLNQTNARVWLYSLINLLRISGKTGLIILIDNFEVMLERSPETGRFLYTPNATKDTYELIRQLIDDMELLENFMLVLSGRKEVFSDERRGITSYEALRMRLESGLAESRSFNPWADIVDLDKHYVAAGGEEFAQKAGDSLRNWLSKLGYTRRYRPIHLPQVSPLRKIIMETALMTEISEEQ